MVDIKYLLILAVFLIGIVDSAGQDHKPDSLAFRYKNMPDDSLKVSELLKLSGEYRLMNASKGIEYAFKALRLAEKIGHPRSVIKSYYMVSAGYITGGMIDSCIYYAKKAETIAEKEQEKALLGNVYNLLGAAHRSISDHKNAIDYGFKSARLLEELKDSTGLSYTFNNLGNLYWDKKDTLNAKKFFEKALFFFEQTHDSLHLPSLYSNLYLVSGKGKKTDYLKKAEAIAFQTRNFSTLSYIYTNLGSFYFKDSTDLEKAKSYYLKGLKFAREVEDLNSQSELLSNLGDLYGSIGEKDSSIFYIKRALLISTLINDRMEIQDEYFTLYELYKSKSKTDSSLYYLELYNQVRDSLYSENILEEIENANALYETEKKEAEIARQKLKIEREEKRRYIFLLIGLTLMILMGSIYLGYYSRQKRKNKETEIALKLKEQESENLHRLNRMKSKFFSNITHELRTPLTLIIGPVKDVIKKISDNKLKESLKIAHSNANKLLRLVNEILDLATLEEGQPKLNSTEVSFYSLIQRIFHSYQSFANVKQLNYTIDVPNDEEVSVVVDQEKLEKVIDNLLSNAFKYTTTGDTIELSAHHLGKSVIIRVRDTGIGIAEQDLDHVFTRYYQGSNSENISGTGIGLSFAQQLTKLMGGSIDVESRLNEGSLFTVKIPVIVRQAELRGVEIEKREHRAEEEQVSYVLKTGFEGKPCILIVEDHPQMLSYLKSILEEHFQVESAHNGFEALEKLKERKFDLVSSDVMMPGMDGFVLRIEMNKKPDWKQIPFILLTARTLKEDKLKGFQLGIDDYITKPFSTEEYIARIYNLINNKLSRDEMLKEKGVIFDETVDRKTIESIEKLIVQNLADPEFNVKTLSKELGQSQRNLSRICKKLTGMTPVNLILEIRLQKAYRLLEASKFKTISEVRYEVGMGNASYFSKKFRERFGVNPATMNRD